MYIINIYFKGMPKYCLLFPFENITIFNLSVLRHFLLTCGKHLQDTIISLRGVHETSLTLPLYIEVPVLTQEGKWLSIGVPYIFIIEI